MDGYTTFKNENGFLKAIYANNEDTMEAISDNMSSNSDIDEMILDKVIKYFKEKNLTVGFISSFEVLEENRGNGAGKILMETFKKEISDKADVTLLLARTENKQSEGFNLESFYEKHGFKGVVLECGDMMMVNNGYEKILDDVLNLKNRRQHALDWFSENGCSAEHQATKDFIIKKEKEMTPIKKKNSKKRRPF